MLTTARYRFAIVLGITLSFALPLPIQAKTPCMSDRELSSYLLWVTISSGQVVATLCAQAFPEFRSEKNAIFAEKHQLEQHTAIAIGAFERAYPEEGKKRFSETVTQSLVGMATKKAITKPGCRKWFTNADHAKARFGSYTGHFENRVVGIFLSQRRNVPACTSKSSLILRQAPS